MRVKHTLPFNSPVRVHILTDAKAKHNPWTAVVSRHPLLLHMKTPLFPLLCNHGGTVTACWHGAPPFPAPPPPRPLRAGKNMHVLVMYISTYIKAEPVLFLSSVSAALTQSCKGEDTLQRSPARRMSNQVRKEKVDTVTFLLVNALLLTLICN